MRTLIAVIVTVVTLVPGAAAVAQDYPHHPVNLSFFHRISTNQNPDISTTLKLNLIYSKVGAVRGLDLNGGVSVISREMKGIQLTGLYSYVGEEFKGIAATAGVNYVRGEVKGAQLAFLVNYDRGRFTGFQYATFFNYTEANFKGIQAATVFNINEGDGGFLQMSGVASFNAGNFRGAQFGTGLNFVSEKLTGLQFGIMNLTDELDGVQVGLANFVRAGDGFMIGVLNMAGTLDGTPIGVVNFADDSDSRWITYGGNLSAINTGLFTNVGGWYSILAVGGVDVQDELDDTVFFSWHYGRRFGVGERLYISPDLGFVHILPVSNDDPAINDEPHFAVQARGSVEYGFNKRFAAFAGIGLSLLWDEYATGSDNDTEPLFFGGVTLK